MAIGVSSTVHAAFTLYARPKRQTPPPVLLAAAAENEGPEYLQSPRGCVVKRVPATGAEGETVFAWLILLDYGLDEASAAFACSQFSSDLRVREDFEPFIPVLFHIDDRVKVLATVARRGERWQLVNQNLHAIFFNFQANQQELYPLELDALPE